MADLQALLQMAQAAGLGGGAPGGAPPPPGGMAPPSGPPPGANPMQSAIQAAMQNQPAYMPPPGAPPAPDPMAYGQGQRTGPATDQDYYDVGDANQSVRGDLPVRPTNDYSGYGDDNAPRPEGRQTPMSTEDELADIQKKMGGDTGPKSGDPSEDGNFPTGQEIRALMSGQIDPSEFDAKWGKGAAKEIQSGYDDKTTDDSDYE